MRTRPIPPWGPTRGATRLAARAWILGLERGAELLSWFHRMAEETETAPVRTPAPGVLTGAGAPLRIAVGIATIGRPETVADTVRDLARQSLPPERVVVCAPTAADLPVEWAAADAAPPVVVIGPRGLTAQRNAILDAVPDCDVILFFDDDFLAHADYLAAIEWAFRTRPEIVGATGRVVADGITGPGYTAHDAAALLAAHSDAGPATLAPAYSGYGCNMAFRMAPIRASGLRFDERLPAYGWLEDVDFSRRVAAHGGLARVDAAVGVHCGVKGGRQSGRRFGYSQIANPIYLVRKGSYQWSRAAWLMSRNVAMNLLRARRPEPWIDRRGRLAGNGLALIDLLRGRLDPARITGLS